MSKADISQEEQEGRKGAALFSHSGVHAGHNDDAASNGGLGLMLLLADEVGIVLQHLVQPLLSVGCCLGRADLCRGCLREGRG